MIIIEKALYHAYRYTLRPLLPAAGPVLYHGIPVGIDHKALDGLFPTYRRLYEDIPQYEATLIGGVRSKVQPGDRVTIIGGGHGATLVFAAKAAGPEGRVTCYEASASAIRNSTETIKRNALVGRVVFIHAIVGKALNVYGRGLSGKVVEAAKIPPCDVMELDCEGAELQILRDLSIRPRTIIVETHGVYGSPSTEVGYQLRRMGYAVTDLGPAEPRIPQKCAQWDLRVLQADMYESGAFAA